MITRILLFLTFVIAGVVLCVAKSNPVQEWEKK